jgi:hypothetical protein
MFLELISTHSVEAKEPEDVGSRDALEDSRMFVIVDREDEGMLRC